MTLKALVALLAVVVALAVGARAAWPREDDHPVDPGSPRAQAAIAVAQSVVPGQVLDVTRDRDSGKWEVTIGQEGREYEVELHAQDLSLLRLDYD